MQWSKWSRRALLLIGLTFFLVIGVILSMYFPDLISSAWYFHHDRTHCIAENTLKFLKLLSAIFHQIFIFSPNNSPSKTMKKFLFHLKSCFRSRDIQIFVIFSLLFHTFQIQKGKWKWSNSWCHELAYINSPMQFLK